MAVEQGINSLQMAHELEIVQNVANTTVWNSNVLIWSGEGACIQGNKKIEHLKLETKIAFFSTRHELLVHLDYGPFPW